MRIMLREHAGLWLKRYCGSLAVFIARYHVRFLEVDASWCWKRWRVFWTLQVNLGTATIGDFALCDSISALCCNSAGEVSALPFRGDVNDSL